MDLKQAEYYSYSEFLKDGKKTSKTFWTIFQKKIVIFH